MPSSLSLQALRSSVRGVLHEAAELFKTPFTPPFAEELREAQREAMLARTQVLIWMSVVVMPTAIWGFTGYFKPGAMGLAVPIVLGAIFAVLVLNVLIKRGVFHRLYQLPLLLTVSGVFTPVASAILALTHESDGNYFFAFFLIYFAFTPLFPASASWMLAASLLNIVSYVVVYLALVPDGLDVTMVSNILYMLELTFIGTIANRVISKLFFDEKRGRLELRDANVGLRELDQAKTQFFSNMNHELRTLLTLILTPINVALQRRDLPDSHMEALRGIRSNAVHLLKTVNMLLDVSRLESGQVKVRLAALQIDDLMRYTASLFEATAQHQGIHLRLELDAPGLTVMTDIDKVEQILVNLVGNALKFTPKGGTITLHSRVEGSWVSLAVQDTGIGIAPRDQSLIFQRFGQVQDAQRASIKGTGIGLSMVQEYAHLLGGTVSLMSAPGEGSTFKIALPIIEPASAAVSAERISADDLSARAADSMTGQLATADLFREEGGIERVQPCGDPLAPWVLVVDDNPSLVRLVSAIIGESYNLYRGSSGEEALEILAEHRVDMVISDVMMPGITGLELCRRIKTTPAWETVPVILLTARGTSSEKVEGLELGADDYIGKPFDPEELRARVRSLFERRQLLERITEKSAALQQALDDLKAEEVKLVASEKMRTLGDLAAGIFHELHNYMNMLYNGALPLQELVLMVQEEPSAVTEEDFAEILELSRLIIDAAQASLAITGELKTYAHQAHQDIQQVDLHDIIRSNVRLFGKLPPGLGVEMAFCPGEVPIRCVPSRMLMVFTNLLKNAFEAMNQQGVVTISTECLADCVEIRLRDTGPGIPASFQERLFAPFQTTKPTGKGLGLGLSLAHKVVHELDGEITYDTAYAGGAQFIIRIPLASASRSAA